MTTFIVDGTDYINTDDLRVNLKLLAQSITHAELTVAYPFNF